MPQPEHLPGSLMGDDEVLRVECETSKGHFFIDLHQKWAPVSRKYQPPNLQQPLSDRSPDSLSVARAHSHCRSSDVYADPRALRPASPAFWRCSIRDSSSPKWPSTGWCPILWHNSGSLATRKIPGEVLVPSLIYQVRSLYRLLDTR